LTILLFPAQFLRFADFKFTINLCDILLLFFKKMNLRIDTFPDFHFIHVDKNDDFSRTVQAKFGKLMTNVFSISRQDFPNFLQMAKSYFGTGLKVFETVHYYSQAQMDDYMSEANTQSSSIEEIINRYSLDVPESCWPSSSSSSSFASAKNCQWDNDIKEINEFKITIDSSKNALIVRFPYNKEIIQLIKQINGRKYDVDQKSWTLPKEKKQELIDRLKSSSFKYELL